MGVSSLNETARLAEYTSQVRVEDLPADVLERAKLLILDNLGCQVAGVEMPWAKRIFDAIAPMSASGRSTVVGKGISLAPDAAAFLNGVVGHSNESDDTHLKSPTHPGAVAIPAALAMGEHVGVDGATLIAATVASYEAQLRISYSVSPAMFTRGHHPPLAVGPFGSAAAASRTLGLGPEETRSAFSIAGSFAGGQMEYTQTGGSVKRLHCGIPSASGLRATLLAQAGVTGPPTVLEGKRGFCAAFAGDYDRDDLVRDLGTTYLLREVSIKLYSCCHLNHQALDGMRDLLEVQPFTSDDVARIRILTTNPSVIHHVGTIIEPKDVLGAQFSISFSLAMYLHGLKCQWWDYTSIDLNDPKLVDLSRRIRMELVDGDRSTFQSGVELVVEMRDGTVRELAVPYAKGEPENPAGRVDVVEKFHRLVEPVIGRDRADEIVSVVDGLEDLDDVRRLGGLL
ncbi:MAG: hypothetical protein GEV10_27075 [Streptosporangiales bacterium]|nr:hypothetical protein [Streptosporangiales bacterium]